MKMLADNSLSSLKTIRFPLASVKDTGLGLYHQNNSPSNSKKLSHYQFAHKKLIVVLDASTPTPDKDSGSNGIFNMLRSFAENNYDVIFVGYDNVTYFPYYTDKLAAIGVYSHFRDEQDSLLPEYLNLDDLFKQSSLIVMCRLNTIKKFHNVYVKYAQKILFHTLDLHYIRLKRESSIQNKVFDENIYVDELKYIKTCKFASVINKYEYDCLKEKYCARNIVQIPINIDIPPKINYQAKNRSGILFVGGFNHSPNVDAISFMLSKPIDSKILINIVGSNLPAHILNRLPSNYKYHGFLTEPSLITLMSSVKLNIVPLRYGAGSKGKVAHAMANCLPTASTFIGTEGMNIPKECIFNFEIDKFHEGVHNVYNNDAYCNSSIESAYDFAMSNFSYSRNKEVLKTSIMPHI